jgi:hypothetical protein
VGVFVIVTLPSFCRPRLMLFDDAASRRRPPSSCSGRNEARPAAAAQSCRDAKGSYARRAIILAGACQKFVVDFVRPPRFRRLRRRQVAAPAAPPPPPPAAAAAAVGCTRMVNFKSKARAPLKSVGWLWGWLPGQGWICLETPPDHNGQESAGAAGPF